MYMYVYIWLKLFPLAVLFSVVFIILMENEN